MLVNAAGFSLPKPFLEHDRADYDAYHDINHALFFLTQTVVQGMVVNGQGGAIVNIGSMWGHQAIGATPSAAALARLQLDHRCHECGRRRDGGPQLALHGLGHASTSVARAEDGCP